MSTKERDPEEVEVVHDYDADYKIENIPVTSITVDRQVQRDEVNMAKVEKMVASFNWDAIGLLTVSDRGHGQYVILDGMHRREVVAIVTDNKGTVPCRVFTGRTIEQEAELFLLLNAGDQPTLYTKYRVGVVGGVADLVAIDKIVHSFGLTVSGSRGRTGNLNAVAALRRIYALDNGNIDNEKGELGPCLLHRTLRILTRAFGTDHNAFQASLMTAVAKILQRYGDEVDEQRLIDKLAIARGGPLGLISRARTLAHVRNIRPPHAMGQILVDEYNTGLHTGSRTSLRNYAK